jgi:hypothetical protein
VVPEFADPAIRAIFVKGFRLVYRVGEVRIWVLAFIWGRRDFMTAWRDRLVGSLLLRPRRASSNKDVEQMKPARACALRAIASFP